MSSHPANVPASIRTPCIKVCAVSGQTGLCIGCGRTLREIATWGQLSDAERDAVMESLPARLRETSPAP
ncbi:MAG: DUF1289 domain-containing protein [Hyphomonadaceae bacterium]|nr:DUF1289 domain-containing protein [Hyphomonadaceae bacterium]